MTVNARNPGTMSYLDQIRITKGVEYLKAHFNDLMSMRNDTAANLLNAENLHFSTFYILHHDLARHQGISLLNPRNLAAIKILNILKTKESPNSETRQLHADRSPNTHTALRWMLSTGYIDDGISNEYDEVLDTTALLLVKLHRDKAILPVLLEMTFNRFRKGTFYYDSVLALFESREPQCLLMIANRFLSNHPRDIMLARNLLLFVPRLKKIDENDGIRQYTHFIRWYRENQPFLYYTGESFQQSCNPAPYAVSLEAKYLCKPVSSTGEPAVSEYEQRFLQGFRLLDYNTRVLLSTYSYWLYRQKPSQWSIWLHYPAADQIKIAGSVLGGLS